ncbi:MltA domain-containing protein [Alteromonas sp. a30]|uniref:MltA domain-containing protein n=1 Tax=Alteromonas sp. a30 TaxID=2730917 RepID=UPI00227E2B8E|nr:MltA domain-containing protein [Alteromonas sp. a30]MCY7295509.1 acetate--CoA ligase [Alteromonas sp. a30]
MKAIFCLSCFLIFSLSSAHLHAAPRFEQDIAPAFSDSVQFDADQLCAVARNTLTYLNQHPDDAYAVHDGVVAKRGASLARVKYTLEFICEVYESDVESGTPSRLNDAEFLKANFDFIRWYPDKEKANKVAKKSTNDVKTRLLNNIPAQQIFLTKYYTKMLQGSAKRTPKYNQALYALPFDEQGMSPEQAEANQSALTRFTFTRQQIIDGALLNTNLAKPLVWITEEALHDVLLQGTGVLQVAGETRYFNVHRNNAIAYDYHLGKNEQARYWYFAEVPGIMGYGKRIEEKIPLAAQVSVAGNVQQLGLGKLFLFDFAKDAGDSSFKQSRLAVLADEGGAFTDNLFQLDLLVGSYYGWSDYHRENKHIPDYANAWIMLAKPQVEN